MTSSRMNLTRTVLRNTTPMLFALVFLIFGLLAPRFLTPKNLEIILSNASYIGIIAVGMTFVLLTGGIDLSVGAVMYVSAVVTGLVVNEAALPAWVGLVACLVVGLAFGAFNAFAVTRIGIVPFVATLVTMIAGRGIGLLITKSVQVDFPDVDHPARQREAVRGPQLNILIYGLVVLLATVYLRRPPPGGGSTRWAMTPRRRARPA